MKKIELNTAMADNSGIRREAGETVNVGSSPRRIDIDRARAAVADGSARTIAVPASKTRPPASKAAGEAVDATPAKGDAEAK